MIYGIQRAYYLNAQNPSDESTLVGIAQEIGIPEEVFLAALHSHEVSQTFQEHRTLAHQLGSQGYPSLVLVHNNQAHFLVSGYSDVAPVLNSIDSILEKQSTGKEETFIP